MSEYKDCPNCGAVNPGTIDVCMDCGTPLPRGGGGNKSLLFVGVGILSAVVAALAVYLLLDRIDLFGGSDSPPEPSQVETFGAYRATFMDNCGLSRTDDIDMSGLEQYIVTQEMYICDRGEYYLGFMFVRYTPDIVPDLDGAVAGSVQEMRANPDISDISCSDGELTIDGLPARKATYTFTLASQGEQGRAHIRYVLDDHDLYMLQSIYPVSREDTYAGRANAVMDSLHFAAQ